MVQWLPYEWGDFYLFLFTIYREIFIYRYMVYIFAPFTLVVNRHIKLGKLQCLVKIVFCLITQRDNRFFLCLWIVINDQYFCLQFYNLPAKHWQPLLRPYCIDTSYIGNWRSRSSRSVSDIVRHHSSNTRSNSFQRLAHVVLYSLWPHKVMIYK